MGYEMFVENVIKEIREQKKKDVHFPEVDLYADQAATYLTGILSRSTLSEEDVFTKDMIANYRKSGLLPKMDGKKYTADHLAFLLMVNSLKDNFSVKEMQRILAPLLENYDSDFDEKYDLSQVLAVMNKLQQEEEELMAKRLSQKVSAIKESLESQGLYDDSAIEISLLILSLAARADANRNLARKLARTYFPDAAAEEKAKRKELKNR
ncbi:MAG: DUF1836 domain-containing protein [Clostridiales bacterium]|nr:DUF1836 domain-containing protein [Clostridiales bacterium]